jgi:hypothetical protein
MSTQSADTASRRSSNRAGSVHHHRAAVALVAAVGYALVVLLSGWPVVLLAGLFVPLSLGVESALRAARAGSVDRRAEVLSTVLGVVVGVAATAVLVFTAGAVGL